MPFKAMSIKGDQKIIVDPSLGRLAKWLRILGFDAVYFNNPLKEKLFFEKAAFEKRMILTRSEKIKSQLQEKDFFFITQNNIDDQLKELIDQNIIPYPKGLFTRCVECNATLRKIGRDEAHGKIPDYIRETQHCFSECANCKKIYWPGTHLKRMKIKVNNLFQKAIKGAK